MPPLEKTPQGCWYYGGVEDRDCPLVEIAEVMGITNQSAALNLA